jgi:hypothetical protein
MIDIREDEIRHLIGRLDRLVTKEQAILRVVQDDPVQGTVIQANQLGYLRLGIEFQKAALAPLEGDEVEVDLAYLLGQETICFEFRRREDGLPAPEGDAAGAGAGGIGTAIFGIVTIVLMGFFFVSCATGVPIVTESIVGLMSGH